MIAADMPCRELVGWVTDYLEGLLPAHQRVRFIAHLRYCGSCRRYLKQMRQTIRALAVLRRRG